MQRVLWSAAWGGLSIAVLASVVAGWTTWSVSLTEEDIQPRIDRFLPQEHGALKLDRAKISLIGPSMRFEASLVGTQLSKNVSGDVLAIGAPSYDSERSGFIFKPASMDLQRVAVPNVPPIGRIGETAARIGARAVPGQGSLEESARLLLERVGNFVVGRTPFYKLEDDPSLSFFLNPVLQSVEMKASKFNAHFKLWRPTTGAVVALLGVGCALSFMMFLLLRRRGRLPEPKSTTPPGSLPHFLRRSPSTRRPPTSRPRPIK